MLASRARDKQASRWLEAHLDTSAGLLTVPQLVAMADVHGDSDHKLVVGDLGQARPRLKTYKGTQLIYDQALPQTPCSVLSFYTNDIANSLPTVAVACGAEVLLYKNLKPFFKFVVPLLPTSALETEIWKATSSPQEMVEQLKQIPMHTLSARSQRLLGLGSAAEASDFVQRYSGGAPGPQRSPTITCMCSMAKSRPGAGGPACLVLATESGQVYFLEPKSFSVVHQANTSNSSSLQSAPCAIACSGLFDVEFRLVLATRDDSLWLLKRGWLEGQAFVRLSAPLVDMAFLGSAESSLICATLDAKINCYSKKGQKIWTVTTDRQITCLTTIGLERLAATLVAVGLRGGGVLVYHGRDLVDSISSQDTPTAVVFGQLGREEHVLTIVTASGALNFKILKRTADFGLDGAGLLAGAGSTSAPPLPLVKRSKLFLEQAMRERREAVSMHQTFQRDLVLLRLETARVLAKSLGTAQPALAHQVLRIGAQILGLGPVFTLILTVENTGGKLLAGLELVLHCSGAEYDVEQPSHRLPLLQPRMAVKLKTRITEQTLPQVQKSLKILVIKGEETRPMFAATITLPTSDELTA